MEPYCVPGPVLTCFRAIQTQVHTLFITTVRQVIVIANVVGYGPRASSQAQGQVQSMEDVIS